MSKELEAIIGIVSIAFLTLSLVLLYILQH